MQFFSVLLGVFILQFANSFAQGHFLTYEDARKAVIQAEDLLTTGGRIQLSSKEAKVDDLFMQHKLDELSRGFRNPELNAAGMHFFKAKPLIERSPVFRFLRQMPKGANLHAHNSASVSSEWVVRNISYMSGLLRCTNKDGNSVLSFRQLPQQHGCRTQYVRVSEERQRSLSDAAYDRSFEQLLNLYTPVPEFAYPSIASVWTKFQNMFGSFYDVLRYLPAYRAYHWQMLEEMYDDNIMYAEIRMDFKELYDISGRTFEPERSVRELQNIVEQFRRQHSNFLGIKVIYSTQRNVERQKIREQFEKFKKLQMRRGVRRNIFILGTKHSLVCEYIEFVLPFVTPIMRRGSAAYPSFIIGFDLVGQEDKGKPLYSFVDALTDLPKTARYFFHAGETNWYGASSDLNLLDAILLNTTRIGHGYALIKHPVLWNAVKTRDIAVEVSPISNQVLHLVWDLRNHPGGFFMSQNIPMVICNDDPGFWNARGLSYDFYYAIMSLAPNHAGLKTLKNLVWSSIRYSVLNEAERKLAFASLERTWEHFMDDVLQGSVF